MSGLHWDDAHWAGSNQSRVRYVDGAWEFSADYYSGIDLSPIGGWNIGYRPESLRLRFTIPEPGWSGSYNPSLSIVAKSTESDPGDPYSGVATVYVDNYSDAPVVVPPDTATLVELTLDWTGLDATYVLWRIVFDSHLYRPSYWVRVEDADPPDPAWESYVLTEETAE